MNRSVVMWFFLLGKRLFKKVSFLLLMVAVPLFAFGISLISEQDSGMLKIALCCENKEDKTASAIIDTLTQQDSVLQFTLVENKEVAEDTVQSGKADAAWVFSEDLTDILKEYSEGTLPDEPPIIIIEREEDVPLQLAREKLYGVLYPYLVYDIYESFLFREFSGQTEVNEKLAEQYYRERKVEGSLFLFRNIDGTIQETGEGNYLITPLRGILGLWIFLGGLAGCLYFLQDEEAGCFACMNERRKNRLAYSYPLVTMLLLSVMVIPSLYLSGIASPLWREVLWMSLYLGISVGLCNLLRRFFRSLVRMAAGIPILLLLMMAICPVFLDIRRFLGLQYFLPLSYYLNMKYRSEWLVGAVLYGIIVWGINMIMDYIPYRKSGSVRKKLHFD